VKKAQTAAAAVFFILLALLARYMVRDGT